MIAITTIPATTITAITTITSMATALTRLLSPGAMYALGWALLHFLWQGTAIMALAASAMSLCRRASVRYLLGVVALVLMLLAPLATAGFYSQQHSGFAPTLRSSESPGVPSTTADVSTDSLRIAAETTVARGLADFSLLSSLRDSLPWLVEAWLVGVAFFSLRSAGGFFLLELGRHKRSSSASPRVLEICRELERRLGLDRVIAYCECQWLDTPAVIGWFRPVVFLPVAVLTGLTEEQFQSVIAHELAHIRRFDAFVNVFQVCVETLLFYHPAVWWLNRRIRVEREHCCDEMAVSLCGNAVEYARALTRLEELRAAPVLAMAANRGPLTERIMRVLGRKTFGDGMRGLGFAASALCLTAALVAGNAMLAMAHPKARAAHAAQAAFSAQAAAPAGAEAPAQTATAAKPSPAHPQTTAQTSSEATSESHSGSYIDAMKAAGLGELTPDQLLALKIQDVTPGYVEGMNQLGLHPTVDKLIAMRVQDISLDYIRELHAEGVTPEVDQLIALKIQDVDANYYRGIKDAGLQPDVHQLIGMKIQGVTPEYVRELHAGGLTTTVDQVIALKIQGVSPAYLKALHDLGVTPTTDNAIGMKIQDVSPEYVREIQALGFRPSVNELISMRIQDVSPAYIKALLEAGFKPDIDEIIGAKVQDVTPEFIERVIKHGFKDLSLQKLIQLRQMGILEPKADL